MNHAESEDDDAGPVTRRLDAWLRRVGHEPAYDPLPSLDPSDPDADEIRARWLAIRTLVREGAPVSGTGSRSDLTLPSIAGADTEDGEPLRVYRERYACLDSLGSGGMGEVFRAFDRELGRFVALKVLRLSFADSRNHARLLAEARVTAQLEHPAIVPVFDAGLTATGETFYVMRLVQGESLERKIQRAKDEGASLSIPFVCRVMRAVAGATATAHAVRLLHRDLKPANVMVGADGGVTVLDWGIARSYVPAEDRNLQDDRRRYEGTPGFMAPEQASGSIAEQDERTDVFGLGALLFAMLSAGAPYRGDEVSRKLAAAESGRRSKPERRDWWDAAPRELRAIAEFAMSRDPAERYPSAMALLEDLTSYEERRPGRAWRDGAIKRARKLVHRNPLATLAVTLSALALLLGFGFADRVEAAENRRRALELDRWMLRSDRLRNRAVWRGSAAEPLNGVARGVLAMLRDVGVDITKPHGAQERLAQLAASDPAAHDRALALVYEFAIHAIQSGASFEAEGVSNEAMLAKAPPTAREALFDRRRTTAREDPELVRIWRPYSELRERLAVDEWQRKLWSTTQHLTSGDGSTADLILSLDSDIEERSREELRALSRLAGLVGESRFRGLHRRLSTVQPDIATSYEELLDTSRQAALLQASQGPVDPARMVRRRLEEEALARSLRALAPDQPGSVSHLLQAQRDLALTCYAVADSLEADVEMLQGSEGTEPVRARLSARATGWRIAGGSWRLRSVHQAEMAVARFAGEPSVLADGIQAFAGAHYDLHHELSGGEFRAFRIALAAEGMAPERLHQHVLATVAQIDLCSRPSGYLEATATNALCDIGLADAAMERGQAKIADYPDSFELLRAFANLEVQWFIHRGGDPECLRRARELSMHGRELYPDRDVFPALLDRIASLDAAADDGE